MVTETTLAFVGGVPGGTELVVILLIAVLLFGANKIPKLARSTGQAMGEFQRGREEIEQELEDMKETASVDTDLESANAQTSSTPAAPTEETSTSEASGSSGTSEESSSGARDTEN